MVRQEFSVRGYWRVIVFYNMDYDFFDAVRKELEGIGFSRENLETLYYDLRHTAKAVTCSNIFLHTSIILLNPHPSSRDFLDSIVHETEHVKQAMLKAYRVEDRGEPPAYTIGYLISRMYPVFKRLL